MIESLGAGFGTVTAGILMLYGGYATLRSKGLPIRGFFAMFRQIKTSSSTGRTVSPFRAFATSLGGTIGVGNLTGVALALSLGGAGAVFWMWVSAFLCMTVKYFEVYLALKYQPKGEIHYGFAPMQYIKKATEQKGFAALFALLGVFSALIMGSMIQTNAAANAALDSFSCPVWVTGIIFTLGTMVFLSGGIRRVTGALEKAVPILGGSFLFLGILVISLRFYRILPAFQRIFSEAFSVSSAAGGFLGSGVTLAFRHGVGNGLFSHEAGLGSAGLAHGACGANPETQGLWGMFEVFADSIVISTVSALMILTTDSVGATGGVLAAAERVLGGIGEGIISVCLILFAFLSVLSWSCYGETCFVWICGKKSAIAFRILFLATPILAIVLPETSLWSLAEMINGSMMILNLTGLLGCSEELKSLAKIDFRAKKSPPAVTEGDSGNT